MSLRYSCTDIVCIFPTIIMENLCFLMDAVLHDKPNDDKMIHNHALFSPDIKRALDVHLTLVGKPKSPFKKFTDSIYLDQLGNWNSTFAVFTAVEGPQDNEDKKS